MPWNGNGAFSRNQDYTADKAAGAPDHFISAAKLDEDFNNLVTGIENTLTRDGQNSPTANLPMNGKKHLNVAMATAREEYATAGQVQDGVFVYAPDSGVADAYVISPSPAIGAYVAGQVFRFVAGNGNTGPSTLNVSGLGAKTIKDQQGADLRSGMIAAGTVVCVVFDGTNFVLTGMSAGLSDAAYTSIGTSGATIPLLDGNNSFSGSVAFDADVTIRTATAKIDVLSAPGAFEIASDISLGTAAILRLGGHDSLGNDTVYGQVSVSVSDATDTSEDGVVSIETIRGGAMAGRVHIGAGLYADGAIGGDPGDGKANFVDVQIDGNSIFPDESLSNNGYAEFGNGLIIQWGRITVNASSTATETFPIAFPTACLSVAISYKNSNFERTTRVDSFTSSQVVFDNGAGFDATVYWIAVGH